MRYKKQLILKNKLNQSEIEFARKSCRALNVLLNVKKYSTNSKNDLLNSINSEFNKICIKNKENAHLLNSVIIFDENKLKFKLNWK